MSNPDKSKKPLDPHSGNSGMDSQIHAATMNQSSVTPQDYPASERETQAAIVGKKNTERKKPGKSPD
jgi:hypothetical protein